MTSTTTARRRDRNRSEIARTAIALFVERGFDDVTVADIAEAAGISQRTFFRYFATKDEVVLDYERLLRDRLLSALEARPAGEDPVVALREAYRQTSHVEPDERANVIAIGRILGAAPTLDAHAAGARLADAAGLEGAIARRLGTGSDDPRARVIVAAMGAVAAREFRQWVADGGADDPAEAITSALSIVEQGLHPREGA